MNQRERIQDAIKRAQYAEHAELITVPMEHMDIALLRTTAIPRVAFLVWSVMPTDTRTQITLNLPEGEDRARYGVVCGCCCVQDSTMEFKLPEELSARTEAITLRTHRLSSLLENACRDHGISTVLVRHADKWREYFRASRVFEAVEAAKFREPFMLSGNGRGLSVGDIVRALRFLEVEDRTS